MYIWMILLGALFVIFMLFQAFSNYMRNMGSPVVTTKAKLARKETHTSTHLDADGVMVSDDIYQLVYTFDTGNEITFNVSKKAYGNAPENEWGTLTYQGTRFLGFEFRAEDSRPDDPST